MMCGSSFSEALGEGEAHNNSYSPCLRGEQNGRKDNEMTKEYTVGLAQISPRLGDVAANQATHLDYIARAGQAGVDLLVFPEASLTGYYLQDLTSDVAMPCDSSILRELATSAADQGMDLALGFI